MPFGAAMKSGIFPLLEVSSKSDQRLGQHLSAFHLRVQAFGTIMRLESAFQGSKVFERGGPYVDLYREEARIAKRDQRLHESGRLIGFRFCDLSFPLEPKTLFYDWLYINAPYPHRAWLERLYSYAGFTDIEFNPRKSINYQVRSCALFVSLMKRGLISKAVTSPELFADIIAKYEYKPDLRSPLPQGEVQRAMF